MGWCPTWSCVSLWDWTPTILHRASRWMQGKWMWCLGGWWWWWNLRNYSPWGGVEELRCCSWIHQTRYHKPFTVLPPPQFDWMPPGYYWSHSNSADVMHYYLIFYARLRQLSTFRCDSFCGHVSTFSTSKAGLLQALWRKWQVPRSQSCQFYGKLNNVNITLHTVQRAWHSVINWSFDLIVFSPEIRIK